MEEAARRPDVAVIGGGIAGCATAYYLSARGLKVTLVDKGSLGYEQSTRNWGWVHQQVRYPHLIPLAIRSVSIWKGLEEELGTALEWRQGGNLGFAFDDAALPGAASGFIGSLHVPSDGQASPQLVTAAFGRAAREHGATLIENCAASAIETAGGRVVSVETEQGEIRADTVVVAGGAWTARLLRKLGLRLPQRAVRATVVRTKPLPFQTAMTVWGDRFTFRQDIEGRFVLAGGASSVYDIDLDALRDIRQFAPMVWRNRHWVKVRAGSRLFREVLSLVPGTGERREFWQRRRTVDPPPLKEVARHTVRQLRATFPSLPRIGVESTWAGYIDSTPDQAPVIGPAPGIDGLHILTGLSGHGFALGPAAAEMQAGMVMDKRASVDTRAFRFARFAEKDLAAVRVARR